MRSLRRLFRGFKPADHLRGSGLPQGAPAWPDGKRATKSFSALTGFDGQVLYLREDLLKQYAAGRRLVWWIWGERRVGRQTNDPTDHLHEIFQRRQAEWRIAKMGEELCPLL